MIKFKVGDKVRVVASNNFYSHNLGKIGTIDKIEPVEGDPLDVHVSFKDGREDWGNLSELQLLESTNPLEQRVESLEKSIQALQDQLNALITQNFVKDYAVGGCVTNVVNITNTTPSDSYIAQQLAKGVGHIKWAHIRNKYEDNGYILNHNHGGITIAYQELTDGSFNVGFALCSANDNFERSTGRKIATERLKDSPHTVAGADLHNMLNTIEDVRDFYTFDEVYAAGPAYINERLIEGCIV